MSPQANFEDALTAYEAKDFVKALNLAKAAAAIGHADSQVLAGHILFNGDVGFTDFDKAAEFYRAGAAQQNSDAQMGLGKMALQSAAGLSPSDAINWFTLAANGGRQDAMRALGEMYLKGKGMPPNPKLARHWLDRASDSGDRLADRKLADSLFESHPKKALEHYEQAAAHGDNEAAYVAAIMYEENLQIKPNTARMTALMRQAAEGGIAAAQADYGLLVYQGRGVARSDTEAARWFEKSAKGGDQEGQFLYAFTLAKGEGVSKDFEEAYYWLLKSGESGQSGISDYDQSRTDLRERLEANVDPAILAKARARISAP